jgi:WD40 repeat protein
MSSGDITILDLDPTSSTLTESLTWHAHDFEAWIVGWNYHDTNILYTGADDCRLKGWDKRMDCSYATFVSKAYVLCPSICFWSTAVFIHHVQHPCGLFNYYCVSNETIANDNLGIKWGCAVFNQTLMMSIH